MASATTTEPVMQSSSKVFILRGYLGWSNEGKEQHSWRHLDSWFSLS